MTCNFLIMVRLPTFSFNFAPATKFLHHKLVGFELRSDGLGSGSVKTWSIRDRTEFINDSTSASARPRSGSMTGPAPGPAGGCRTARAGSSPTAAK